MQGLKRYLLLARQAASLIELILTQITFGSEQRTRTARTCHRFVHLDWKVTRPIFLVSEPRRPQSTTRRQQQRRSPQAAPELQRQPLLRRGFRSACWQKFPTYRAGSIGI